MRYGRHVLKKSHQRPAVQVITASNFPFNTTMFDSEVCYIRHLLQQNHEDAATRFDMADICLETAAKTRFVACVVCHGYTNLLWADIQDPPLRLVVADTYR